MNNMNITQKFFKDSSTVLRALYERSKVLDHRVLQGRTREFFIREFLERAFPKKHVIGNGIILDTHGIKSREADIIVYNESMPLLDYGGGTGYFFSDGVLAHIEVKTNLNSRKLREALCVTESVKRLDKGRTRLGAFTEQNIMSFRESPLEIFSCVFAYEGLEPKTFKETFCEYYEDKSDYPDICVDMVCVLDRYIFKLDKHAKEKPLGFWETGEDSLIVFFLRLLRAMYQRWRIVFDMTDYLGDPEDTLPYKSIDPSFV